MYINVYQYQTKEKCKFCNEKTELMFAFLANAQMQYYICSNCFVSKYLISNTNKAKTYLSDAILLLSNHDLDKKEIVEKISLAKNCL